MNAVAIPALVLSFFMVSRGAGWLTESIRHISARRGVSAGALGMVLASLMTTMPELTVSTMASALKDFDLSVGNAVGSTIFNVLGIIGICGLVRPLDIDKSFLLHFGRNVLLVYLAFYSLALIGGSIGGTDGILLFLVLALSLYQSYRHRHIGTISSVQRSGTGRRDLATLVAGGAVLGLGSYLLIYSATSIASDLGIPQLVIGLSLVAVGTSIPELATGLTSTKNRVEEISIGNILGANVYNITLVLGCSSLISTLLHNAPLPAGGALLFFNIPAMICVTICLMVAGRHGKISRPTSALFLLAYALYIGATFSGFPGARWLENL